MKRSKVGLSALLVLGMVSASRAQNPDPSLVTVDRLITADEFRTQGFGPARWLEDGSGYTTLESGGGGAATSSSTTPRRASARCWSPRKS